MANIENVDYAAIPSQAKLMREKGQELNSEISSAYNSIAEMHNSWYGQRYNELVQGFNDMIPQINELLELVVGELPFTLETIANNYANLDTGTSITTATKTEPQKIADLSVSNDVGMRFVSEDVNSVQASVSTNFSNAKEKMNEIEVAYRDIQWQSDASTAFEETFTQLKNTIVQAFEDINTQFTQLINQTQEDFQNAESSNTTVQ